MEPRNADTDERLDAIVGVLDGANVLVHTPGGRISHWSSGCEELYGWHRDEVVGKIVHDLLATEFPEPLVDIHARLRETGVWTGNLRHRHHDGSVLWIASRWVVIDPETNREPSILQTNVDVSDLKHAQEDLAVREAQMRSIVETVPEAMVVIDERGIVTSFSATAERLFGYRANEVCGENVSLLMPSPDREAHDAYISRYLTTGERRIIGYGRVVTGRRKDGSTFPMELAIGEAVANSQRIFTGFIRDLTSRKKIEEELRQAQKMEAVGQLTGGIAHDFNNLLTVISGNLEMLEMRLSEPRQQALLREAQEAVDDGAKLIGQLLAFGRRQPLNPKLSDVGQLVANITELLRRSLGETIELKTVVNGALHQAMVDASQFQNALLNLALNARDAMPRGGRVTIEISNTFLDPDYAQMYPQVRTGDYVLVAVTDTGAGMTEEVKSHAFEPFFTTKDVGSGTGLGLSMVYGFVKQSGGHVQLYSEIGQGTSVRLFLPAVRAATTDGDREVAAAMAGIPRGHETILVVEDDPRVRRVAVARLIDTGYRVIEATNATEALAALRESPDIDLVFTDIVMPGGMTGIELAREVRVLRPEVPVLFTSGYAEPNVAGREIGEGSSWLKKPYTARELATRLRELLD
ncbi:hybrid sensor histidine kinase/response regulator [Segnochrobactrum spirostomi]|uniref:Sensor protein FixL n=1 Tax=Segnochrobactrum spirostomi TaxID=2608987 RepID=A0A6A7Y0E5_9HYPH|nr:PAS domain-containing sensor histidine kinase [Segnochrobactrum spirostomi]MQT12205.1 PAS domain S-box protein [Segnochrobactrum spirostomi]